ncbi:QcrA and Rieske domain-containing protein [Fodinicola feengrottensis]|uniref:Cytochrome bc1 complex Rieske iron-sulfur subunit n=1 Tax=Fodinicola feengrottensis TaxID=435914 RepID=A0ABN2HD51_9ACTN|nr:Rieske 2Fe-2S domain-containing protein [Fodinicola feengrottensis]
MTDSDLSRRKMLASTAVAVGGTAVLAACGSSPTAGTATPTAGSGTSAPAAGATSAPAGGAVLAKLSDVPVGQAISSKDDDGKPICIAQPTAGTAVAFSAICTHMGCTVAPAGKQLNCPCHGSQYDAFTGKVLAGPAPKPLPAVDVHVAGGNVVYGKS